MAWRVGNVAAAALVLCGFGANGQPLPAPMPAPSAQPDAFTAGAPPSAARLPGYLAPDQAPDASLFLPPAPRPGSPAHAADVAAYRQLRAQEGSARWRLAASDANLAPSALMDDFACALGARLDPIVASSLNRLILRMGRDAGAAAARVKQVYKRPRPFLTNAGTICLPRDKDLVESFSYPSGHSSYSWAVGLVLAELAPDRAAQVLARARAYGESRAVCGVHYLSDVEQGRSVASGVVAVLHADPSFLTDLSLARAEVIAARSKADAAPPAGQCRAEADALALVPSVAAR